MNVSPQQKKKVQNVNKTNVVNRDVTEVNWNPWTNNFAKVLDSFTL